jgi:phosphoserine phosphatase
MRPLSNAENRNATTGVDPLPSWNQGIVKARILNFVKNVTDPENTNYITPEDRIAVFDNDGTLWAEKPTYFQGFFVLDRLEELSKSNPEIRSRNPQLQQLLLNKNLTNLQLSKKDVMSLVLLTHSNITQHEFNKMVQKWAETAHHPQTQKRFVQMVYKPMNELIDFLKNNHFKTFIVSGGGIDFVREALSKVYGIPHDQIIGSSIKFRYTNGRNGGNSTILREPELASFNEKEVKPENIQLHIGKVPVFAVGNSDGDLEMLRYTADNNSPGKSLELLIHHDDGVREYSYDTLAENLLIEAQRQNWTIVSMKDDFRIIYPNTNSAS